MRSVQNLVATAYLRSISSGRSKPAIFLCEDSDGNSAGEYVLKLQGGMEGGGTALTCELVSSLVADYLGVPTPAPAIVQLDTTIGELIANSNPEAGNIIRRSGGKNFASKVLSPGFKTWPVGKGIPAVLRATATEIFALDALIQNPDRRYDNPNLLWGDDQIFVIDHDAAFSFLLEIGPHASPWELERLRFLDDHVFYRDLKGRFEPLDRFIGAVESMHDDAIDEIASEVPEQWGNAHLERITSHLKNLREHSEEFAEAMRRRLA